MATTEDVLLADERATLQAFVDDQRREIASLLDGVSEEEARRSLVPSLTTLASIVKHCAFVERVWFQVGLAGRTRAGLGLPDDVDDSFVLDDADTVESLLADYAEACAESDRIASGHSLDDLVLHNRRSPLTLRWVYAHMIRELARHAGHGDILREQIEAARGRQDP
ncbi:DinB family protein [Longivirga aurantiaca]|uniref:DinB family protein n=1 Tax=Longivirga aurantiaca TaxID=1837743 RepID=A0ABW1SY45_9ACTN